MKMTMAEKNYLVFSYFSIFFFFFQFCVFRFLKSEIYLKLSKTQKIAKRISKYEKYNLSPLLSESGKNEKESTLPVFHPLADLYLLSFSFKNILIGWFFILAMSTLSPSKITEELLSKKCQGDLELKNSTEYNKTLKCSFCHKNIHENIKRFAYIATLMPFNQSESFESYELKGVISSFQKVNNSAPCKNLLQYTTWFVLNIKDFFFSNK